MTIPASDIVVVNPGVIGAGGSPLALNGLIVTKNSLTPVGAPLSFSTPAAVSSWYGPASDEYALSQIYFLGFDDSTIKPGALLFAPYADADRAAWIRSGSLAGMTLAQLQALSGTLILTVDGTLETSGTINLSGATSFTNAATLIAAGFTGAPLTCAWDAVSSTFTLTSSSTGALSSITFATGTLSASLNLTSATGAILSQGAVADTPATAMDSVVEHTQNWVSFATMWEPDITNKELFAVWTNAQNQRYVYVVWDTDGQAVVQGSTTSFGYIAKSLAYDTVMPISGDASVATELGYTLADLVRRTAVFTLGMIASIDFSQTNGRITAAFKHQSGFVPSVQSKQVADNLRANGYSFYGSWATANDQFNGLSDGQVSGKWSWLDPFVNQVYLNSQFQLALINLLFAVKSIPYNESGYSLIRAAMIDPVLSALNFGSIRVGVSLSQSQSAQLNQQAGRDVTDIVEQQGYYLQILDPGAQVRGLRGTPVINFWYTDGGAVQHISVASIDIF